MLVDISYAMNIYVIRVSCTAISSLLMSGLTGKRGCPTSRSITDGSKNRNRFLSAFWRGPGRQRPETMSG